MTKRSRKIDRGRKVVGIKDAFFNIIVIMIALALVGITMMTVVIVDKTFGLGIFGNMNGNGKVPVLEIQLTDTTLSEVHENSKETKYPGNTMILNGNKYENVEFKGRGNFSWAADKKSYRLKFDSKVSLLNMEKAKKWALISNSVDGSLMRNDLAYYLTDLVMDGYPFRGEYVDLKIDGEELGLYYLIQSMDIGKKAVNLHDAMGVLVELDNVYCENEEKWYVTAEDNCLTLKDAVVDDNANAAMDDFVKSFDALEKAVKKNDYKRVEELADVRSFAEYYVISEITANPDAYVTSWFMYKDGVDDKIHAGLTWDFDAAFGNREWGKDMCVEEFYSPTVETIHMGDGSLRLGGVKTSQMLYRLIQNSSFKSLVGEVYRERLLGKKNAIMDYIDSRKDEISVAAKRDAKIWKKENYDENIDYLKQWLVERMDYFEKKFTKYINLLF